MFQRNYDTVFFSSAFFALFFKHVIWFRFGKLESVYIIQDALYFLEAMCIVLRKRCHIYAFLTEHLKFQEQTSSSTKTVGKYCQIKKKIRIRTLYTLKKLYTGFSFNETKSSLLSQST